MKKFILFILCLFLTTNAIAASVKLQWDYNTESDVIGYYVYSRSNTSPFTRIGTSTVNTFLVDGISQPINSNLFFAVTAFNDSGLESSFSNIVNVDRFIPVKPIPFLKWE